MNWERRKKMMIRFSVMSGILIALFWSGWHLIVGQVPVVTSIQITKIYSYILPFEISRWWAILLGPLYSSILVLVFTFKKVREDIDLVFLSLVVGVFFILAFGLNAGLVFSLVVGLIVGLVFSLVFGLAFGLAFGLVFSLVVGVVFGLAFGLVVLLKVLLNKNSWKNVTDWFLVRKLKLSHS